MCILATRSSARGQTDGASSPPSQRRRVDTSPGPELAQLPSSPASVDQPLFSRYCPILSWFSTMLTD